MKTSNQTRSAEEIQKRLQQLGFACPAPPPTHLISAPVYALLCMPMHYVAIAHLVESNEGREESVIDDLFGVKSIKDSFVLSGETSELPVADHDALVLRKLLVNRRAIDSIIYDFAIETINMFFEIANDDVIELAKTIVARTIVSVAQASGDGWLGSGAKASPEQNLLLQTITDKLDLASSPTATAILDRLRENPIQGKS